MKLKKIHWILLLALILRLINLNQSLWLDEGIQWWASTTFPLKHLVTEYIKGDFNPPLFHIIIHFWTKLFGTSEIALRLPSVIFGVLTVLYAYKIAKIKKIKPNLVALLVATAPLLIYYSQEARMYSLAAFTATAAIYYFLKKNKLAFIISTMLMLYSHYLTWTLIPIFLFFQPLLTIIALMSLLPWLPTFISQLTQGLSTATINPIWGQVVGGLSIKNISLIPIKFLIGRISIKNNLVYALVLVPVLTLASYLLFKALKRIKTSKLIWSWFLVPLILGIILSLKIPLLSYFRFVFILPAFYLLLSQGISLTSKKSQKFLIISLLAINMLASSIYLLFPQFHRENWKKASQHAFQLESPVVVYSAVSSPFDYYNQATKTQAPRITEKNLDQLINQPSVIYIPYAQPIFDPQQKVLSTIKDLGFIKVSKKHFRGVTVIYFENTNFKPLS